MPSTLNAHSAAAYELAMGRWSRCLAPLLIGFVGVTHGERILDVGCGTGSLTFALPRAVNIASVTGIDLPGLMWSRHAPLTPMGASRLGRVTLVPCRSGRDRTVAMLSLQFMPQPDHAVAEMRRVVRPGGVVAAAVWDSCGGIPSNRMFWDVAGVLNPGAIVWRARMYFNPILQHGGLARSGVVPASRMSRNFAAGPHG